MASDVLFLRVLSIFERPEDFGGHLLAIDYLLNLHLMSSMHRSP